jgi:hypothetical protein
MTLDAATDDVVGRQQMRAACLDAATDDEARSPGVVAAGEAGAATSLRG